MARQKEDMNDFWERVDAEIRLQKKSKLEVARRCGFDRKKLSDRRNISISFLAKLCEELNISADYLLFGNDWEMEEC